MKRLLFVFVVLGALMGASPRSFGQTQYWPLVVDGSQQLKMGYTEGTLTVQFHRTLRGAGGPEQYIKNVPEGSGSWLDRPIGRTEPLVLKQKMEPDQAKIAMDRLSQRGGYWMFYCWNTGQGYYVVSKSQRANATVRFD